ncbi:MAG: pyridoxal-phosphate dependent enzyme, partial [Ilumatobacteraceae bacterium]
MSPLAPDQPAVTPADIEAAAARLAGRVRVTPVLPVTAAELSLPIDVTLKLELLQHVGSFKPRGAFNRVLAAGQLPAPGLVAASGGNHGAAVAFVAASLGVPANVFVPSTSPQMKRDRIASLGATVHVIDGLYDDAQAAATAHQAQTGALAVHPFDHVDVVAGQGTLARELEQQVDGFDTVLVATGGGGFTAGQAAWFAGRKKVVSVEPATSQCLHAARMAGEPVTVSVAGVAAD